MNKFSIVVALAVLLTASTGALADEPTSQPTTLLTTDASVDTATASLVGTWNADMTSFETNLFDALSVDERAMLMGLVHEAVLMFTYNADGTYTSYSHNGGEESSESGTWQVLGVEGDLITFQTVQAPGSGGAQGVVAEPETGVLHMVDADTFIMIDERPEGYMRFSVSRD